MNRFWDLTEKQMANLTRDQVEQFVDVELMEAGLLRVAPLVLDEVPPVPEPTGTCFRIRRGPWSKLDAAFSSIEDARKFLALRPLIVEPAYLPKGCDHVDVVKDFGEPEIYEAPCFTEGEFARCKEQIDSAKEIAKRNEKAVADHEKATRAQNTATERMWNAWREASDQARQLQGVIDTFEKYKKIADGDETIAARFLGKAFSAPVLTSAAEWFGITLPPQAFGVEQRAVEDVAESTNDIAF